MWEHGGKAKKKQHNLEAIDALHITGKKVCVCVSLGQQALNSQGTREKKV